MYRLDLETAAAEMVECWRADGSSRHGSMISGADGSSAMAAEAQVAGFGAERGDTNEPREAVRSGRTIDVRCIGRTRGSRSPQVRTGASLQPVCTEFLHEI